MRSFIVFLFSYFVFKVSLAKIFSDCELATEIHTKHNVSLFDVHLHLCIANPTRDTSLQASSDHLGLYRISKWACKEGGAGGTCNIDCDNLINDDISDDLACAMRILNIHGISIWEKLGVNAETCQKYNEVALGCLKVYLLRLMTKFNWTVTPETGGIILGVNNSNPSTDSPGTNIETSIRFEKGKHALGEPLNILVENFRSEVLRKIFLNPIVKNRKIVVLSIAGISRKGKSFFLDYCLRFMYATVSLLNSILTFMLC